MANKLIVELELSREPIRSLVELDGEFVWLIVENVFKTDLLPKWSNLDFIDETEEFQFILMTLEQIFDLDLNGINPAHLTLRKPDYIRLVLNALYLANSYIKFKRDDERFVFTDLIESVGESVDESNSASVSSVCSTTKSTAESFSAVENELPTGDGASKKAHCGAKLERNKKSNNEIGRSKVKSKFTECRNESSSDEKVANQLKELNNRKQLINNLTCVKEQGFALELSYKIMDVLKIQEKSKEIKSNLDKLNRFRPQLTANTLIVPTNRPISKQFGESKLKRPTINQMQSKRSFGTPTTRRRPTVNKRTSTKSVDLSELLTKLIGLSNQQMHELRDKTERQRELVNQIKLDLIERERNLHGQLSSKVEKENRLLELLQRDMNLSLSYQARNSLEHKHRLKKAKDELRRERVELRRQLDEYYTNNLSDYMHLETEQDKQLKAIANKNDESFRANLTEARKEIREWETEIRRKQTLALDNYDNFYATKHELMKRELVKQRERSSSYRDRDDINATVDRSQTKHLERTFKSKLYPKFH